MRARRHLAREIKRLRKERRQTQAAMAEALDIEVRHLQYLEAGELAPGFDLLVDLAGHFGVRVGDLLSPD